MADFIRVVVPKEGGRGRIIVLFSFQFLFLCVAKYNIKFII